jgi:predicted PurR-regulated permease PerM
MTSQPLNPSTEPPHSLDQPPWWYRPLIWAGFLAVLYALREFFLIGFLTFLFCFVMRGLVGFLTRRAAPQRVSRALDLTLTLSIFLAICLSLYGLGRYFVPPVLQQGKSLLAQLQEASAEDVQNSLLANTVGTWRFHQQCGAPQDDRYKKAFQQFQESGRSGAGLYQAFPPLNSRLRAEFEAAYEQAQVLHLQTHGLPRSASNGEFEQWFLQLKAPQLYHERSDYYLARWQAEFASRAEPGELAALKQRPNFLSIRDAQIRQQILTDVKSDPVRSARLKNQWARARSIRQWAEFRQSTDYQAQFKTFYETRRAENPAAAPLDYPFFRTLAAAYPNGKQDFLAAVRQHYESEDESRAHQQHDFEVVAKLGFGQQWWATSPVAEWAREHAKNDGPRALAAVVGWVDRGLGYLVRVPIQVATSLLLAVFILIEWQGLKKGVANIRHTRLQPVFDEISPGVTAMGKLIGKSFQGQVVIAVFNAFFTLVALWLIGVEYKFILALIVFVFSFIPVVGVILSGIPLCAVAVSQPGGSLLMAVQVIVAIAVIHLIEAMILSPRIIGKIGHLHPVLVIAILLVAEKFFGMWGLILGVPVAIYLIRIVILNTSIPGVYEA